nr:MAG TPA: Lines C-terminus [Caudoviricetes sp.]
MSSYGFIPCIIRLRRSVERLNRMDVRITSRFIVG